MTTLQAICTAIVITNVITFALIMWAIKNVNVDKEKQSKTLLQLYYFTFLAIVTGVFSLLIK